jgi:hypothetical protein
MYEKSGHDSIKFFCIPMGCENKTFADTSMQLPNRLPQGQEFVIHDIRLSFLPTEGASMVPISDICQLSGDALKLAYTGEASLLIGSFMALSAIPIGVLSREVPLIPRLNFDPIIITEMQNFVFELRWPNIVELSENIRIAVFMSGKLITNNFPDGIFFVEPEQ